ncbi:MAG: ABC transporter permease [Phycisphaerae bacterium]|nr:ABC transporter permease [Phycisphaerae bacterium]
MFGQTLTIARNTFVESVRQPIYFILILVCGVLQVFTTWGTNFSLGYTDSSEVSGDNKLLLDIGLGSVFVCGTLLASFIATAVVSREIDNRTILTVVSKPVSRPTVILGKYLGVVTAILIAIALMLLFLLLAVRHGVMSKAADELDGPVIVFGIGAAFAAILIGLWCNFFYGWVFAQTASLSMLPLMTVAYLLVLLVKKDWSWQPLGADLKPQILMACGALALALVVLTAVATAASTRLGQVATICIAFGALLLGLLSNTLFGSFTFQNDTVARIRAVEALKPGMEPFRAAGDSLTVTLESAPRRSVQPGDSFYYGPNPSGFDLLVPTFPRYTGDLSDRETMLSVRSPAALVITAYSSENRTLTVLNAGEGLAMDTPPRTGDYVFLKPTRMNVAAVVLWGVIPNFQFFWLLDAITQNQKIPAAHIVIVLLYAAAQVGAFLSLAVLLFQERETG